MCEWNQLQKNPIEHITAGPINEDNIYVWEATIHGPKDTPYEGGIFYITITFPEKYPFVPMSRYGFYDFVFTLASEFRE